MKIPSLVLRQLYTNGSLSPSDGGVSFSLKNRLMDARLSALRRVTVGETSVGADDLTLELPDGTMLCAATVTDAEPLDFPVGHVVTVHVPGADASAGVHAIHLDFAIDGMGDLDFDVHDSIQSASTEAATRIPRDPENDYTPTAIATRQAFLEQYTGAEYHHVKHYSVDPETLAGNVEAFVGVAQIPLGIAGPLLVNGEHAQGEFLVPMATTEGTLVASYNRGMKVLNLSGGVTCTVSDDQMQRAPVFIFETAREARDFRGWLDEHMDEIRARAEATTSVGKLLHIDTYLSNHFAFCRFNFSTGDAAGQNMVGRATFAACSWILETHTEIRRFYLESNFATDKKASMVNIMRTRGKRVTAECHIKGSVLREVMRVEPAGLAYHWGVAAGIGSLLSGANNNGLHSPNGITAMFMATGQDVANVSESSAAILYVEHTPEDNLFMSITIPSLIIATHGGGTGLATQRECLQMLDCVGRGKAKKLAEIIAGVVLAGEISLGSAISSNDWVSSHEKYGRNR